MRPFPCVDFDFRCRVRRWPTGTQPPTIVTSPCPRGTVPALPALPPATTLGWRGFPPTLAPAAAPCGTFLPLPIIPYAGEERVAQQLPNRTRREIAAAE